MCLVALLERARAAAEPARRRLCGRPRARARCAEHESLTAARDRASTEARRRAPAHARGAAVPGTLPQVIRRAQRGGAGGAAFPAAPASTSGASRTSTRSRRPPPPSATRRTTRATRTPRLRPCADEGAPRLPEVPDARLPAYNAKDASAVLDNGGLSEAITPTLAARREGGVVAAQPADGAAPFAASRRAEEGRRSRRRRASTPPSTVSQRARRRAIADDHAAMGFGSALLSRLLSDPLSATDQRLAWSLTLPSACAACGCRARSRASSPIPLRRRRTSVQSAARGVSGMESSMRLPSDTLGHLCADATRVPPTQYRSAARFLSSSSRPASTAARRCIRSFASISSFGYVVAALEHEDGSACYADAGDGAIPYKRPPDAFAYGREYGRRLPPPVPRAAAPRDGVGDPPRFSTRMPTALSARCSRSRRRGAIQRRAHWPLLRRRVGRARVAGAHADAARARSQAGASRHVGVFARRRQPST